MTYEELKIALEEAEKAFEAHHDNIDATWDFNRPWAEYRVAVWDTEVYRTYARLAEEEKLRRPSYNLKPADDFDIKCRYPINEFIDDCKLGMFCDYDGIGYYGTETHRSDIYANPSELVKNARKDFKYIYWYNK